MRIVLVDDHPVFRAGIRQILSAASDFELVGEAGNAREGLALIDSSRPDFVIMDLTLPGMDGVIATREIRRRVPKARVLILTMRDQLWDVLEALDAGASGYALKTDAPDTLIGAIRVAAAGERYVAPSIAGRLVEHELKRRGRVRDSSVESVLSVLSVREREVFRLAANCLITREIASELCISRKTVDTHLYRIHRKLGLRTSAELVRLASALGILPPPRGGDANGTAGERVGGP